jgi:hypothetical protein
MLAPVEITSGTREIKSEDTIVRTTKFNAKCSLELAEDLGIGDSLAGLVILQDGRLLVYTGSEILLGKLFLETGCLHGLCVDG